MAKSVLVVIGIGGMGEAIARRLGSGRPVLLSDYDVNRLESLGEQLRQNGYDVHTQQVDVSDRDSLTRLADRARELGSITALVHTAGLSPAQAPADRIIEVDLVGTALSLEVFGEVIEHGGAGVYIASVAGHILGAAVDEEAAKVLATAPVEKLSTAKVFDITGLPDDLTRALTYGYCKRGNQLRVQYAAPTWAKRGARVNCISPGVIATAMGWAEFNASFQHQAYEAMVHQSAAGRFGTAEDVAAAAEFLLDPARAGFITGTDLLVDGGVVAGIKSGELSLG
jgi:NAD(P)-dependent dehydrogenase (short-subunit alcohol dehydrogenase family)